MYGSFSEEALQQFASMAAQTQSADFAEGGVYDFTRCVRPNGTAYGTGGKCRKGTEEASQEKKAIVELGSMLPKGEKIVDSKGGLHTAGGGSRGPVDHEARIAKHDASHEAAKTAHAASKAALAAHRGRDAQSRAKKQQLAYEHQKNTEKLETAADKLIRAKIAGKRSEDAAKPKAPAGSDSKKKMTEMATRIKRQETAIARMSPGKYTRKEIEIEKQTLQEMKAKLKGLVSGKAAEKAKSEAPIAPVPSKPIKDPVPGVLAKAKELKDFNRKENQRVTDLAKAGKIKGVDPGAVERILAKKAAAAPLEKPTVAPQTEIMKKIEKESDPVKRRELMRQLNDLNNPLVKLPDGRVARSWEPASPNEIISPKK